MAVASRPFRKMSGRSSTRSDPGRLRERFCQISDSGTSRADPQDEQRRHDAHEEDRAPAEARQHQADHHGRDDLADRPGGLHQAERLAAVLGAPGLGDERGARRPLAAHAEPQQEPEDRELHDGGRQPAGPAGQRVHQDREDERARAADAVGQEPEGEAAEGGRDERERVEQPARALVHAQVVHEVRQHERVEHHVHGVEHPAEAARHERALLGRGDLGGPGQPEHGTRSGGAHAADPTAATTTRLRPCRLAS